MDNSIKVSSDRSAAVNHEFYWIPIEKESPPEGVKLLLFNEKLGVAVISNYRRCDEWTHWQGLPKHRKT